MELKSLLLLAFVLFCHGSRATLEVRPPAPCPLVAAAGDLCPVVASLNNPTAPILGPPRHSLGISESWSRGCRIPSSPASRCHPPALVEERALNLGSQGLESLPVPKTGKLDKTDSGLPFTLDKPHLKGDASTSF